MAGFANIPSISTGNALPSIDGDSVIYRNAEALKTSYFSHDKKAIFINGMMNENTMHKESALALSLMLMSPVLGIYNKKTGFVADLWQCLADKYQFDGPLARAAKTKLNQKKLTSDVIDFVMGQEPQKSRTQVMVDILSRNPAAATAFLALRDPAYSTAPIYAHSQGNLILANALNAIAAIDGPQAIAGRKVYSFGSPTVNWPEGINHQEFAFTGDPVALLSGIDMGFKISKVGSYPKILKQDIISHGFNLYMANDPAFVVNRFRWGGWGLTVSLDEKGLADALISMGKNLRRVKNIFVHLDDKHSFDVDDVALLYVERLKAAEKSSNINASLARVQLRYDAELKKLLIRSMNTGFVTRRESSAVKYVRALR